ncbi:MAG: GNAT family protein [Anaerolineales bacterium]
MDISRDVHLRSDDGRFVLRPYETEDAESIYDAVYASRAELAPWMDWCTPDYSIADTRAWLPKLPGAWERKEIFGFAILDASDGTFLGGCGLNNIIWEYRIANLGYWVRSNRTGEGVATAAAVPVARFGLEKLGLCRIEIVAAVGNTASRRVAEKTGATFEGILRNRIKIGDRNLDAAMHSLIPGDFERS